jgi:predicted nucleic-acid-binding Zn-ribbon protein
MSGETQEAQCPKCHEWSPVYWFSALPPGGYWWKTAGCPKCGHVSLVETECEFRDAAPTAAKEGKP